MPHPTVLVVDDESLIRWSLTERLKAEHYQVLEAETGRAALEKLPEGVDLVLLDYKLPDTDGVSVLRKIKEFDQDILVILLTAYASVETAVEAMKFGAYHFANKPFNLDDVVGTVERALETTRLRREVRQYRTNAAKPYSLHSIVGSSDSMTSLRHLVARVATSPASTVLLTGESGTGKDLVAKIIHYTSDRASRPFMNITCSALPEHLLESELFGHERGAFTDARLQKRGLLETADGGTVFLDEIGEMVPSLQAKLLRFLEEKAFKRVGGAHDIKVDVRVVAASNRNLEDEVAKGRFRSDLFYRLNVLPVAMPPLRSHAGRRSPAGRVFHRPVQHRVPQEGARREPGGVHAARAVRLARERPGAAQRGRAGHAALRRPTSGGEGFCRVDDDIGIGGRLRAAGHRRGSRTARTQPGDSGAPPFRRESDQSGDTPRPQSRSDPLPDREVQPDDCALVPGCRAIGIVIVATVPPPGRGCRDTVPSCSSISRLTMGRPSPVPPFLVV